MIQYQLYAWWMKLAHRHNWHHMKPCYPDGDTMLVCHWCGIRIVTYKRTDGLHGWGTMPNAPLHGRGTPRP